MNRRLIAVAVPLAVGALALSACSNSKSSSSSGSSGGKPSYAIAYQGPLSGGNAQLGLNMKFGVQLAINQANATGTLPFTLKYAEADDQGSPTTAPAAAQSLIGNSSVIAVVGPAFSGATRASEPFFSQADLASVTPSATAVDLTQHGWKNFYRALAPDSIQGKADADYVSKVLHATSAFVIDDASSYGAGLAKAFKQSASADGVSVKSQTAPGTTQCQAGTGNVQQYAALAGQVKAQRAPVVFYAGYYCDFALLAKALRSGGYTGQLFSDDGSKDAQYVTSAGASVANGTLLSCACSDVTKIPGAAAFSTAFQALAHFPASVYSAESYDVANAIIAVLKDAATGGAKVTRAEVAEKLATSSYQGLTKTLAFGPDHNVSGNAVYIYKVVGGTVTQLGLASKLIP